MNPRPHVVTLYCEHCTAIIGQSEVLVYADASGRDAAATDPYHLACFLRSADPHLPSNEPLNRWARRVAGEALDNYLGKDTDL